MTTVVFKNGVMAADSLVTCNGKVEGYTDKIVSIGKLVIGVSGSLICMTEFLRFMKGEEYASQKIDKDESGFEAIVVNKETREIKTYISLTPEHYDAEFYAVGSGADIARGALLMGASPAEAVKAAAKLDLHTGGKIKTMRAW